MISNVADRNMQEVRHSRSGSGSISRPKMRQPARGSDVKDKKKYMRYKEIVKIYDLPINIGL